MFCPCPVFAGCNNFYLYLYYTAGSVSQSAPQHPDATMYDKIKSKGISVAKRLRRVAIAQVVLGCTSLAISFSLISNILSVASASLALSLLGADPASAFANSQFDAAIRGLDISIIVFACIEIAGCAAVSLQATCKGMLLHTCLPLQVWGTLIAPAIIREALYAIGSFPGVTDYCSSLSIPRCPRVPTGTGSLAGYSGNVVLSSQIFVIEWTAVALVSAPAPSVSLAPVSNPPLPSACRLGRLLRPS